MQKIVNIISIFSFFLVTAIAGSGVYSYFWFQGNKEALMDKALKQVTKSIKLPKLSSPALPTAAPSKNLQLPKF
tara:strand:+ start:574 stop:795 length:222 start_codon:yes stop_codon:yes gene_type:complete